MRKLLAIILAVGIVGAGLEPVLAAKSYSSGRSSGPGISRSGGSKPSSAGSSWKPSSKPHGKSFSSGFSNPSRKPSASGSTSRSYSSGGGIKKTSPSPPVSYGQRSSSGGGFSDPKRTAPTASPPAGKDYASGSRGSAGTKPSGRSYYTDLARARAVEESKARYQQATSPKPTYTDPKGNQHKIDPSAKPVEKLRTTVTEEKYVRRPERAREVFRPATLPNTAAPHRYGDPFGALFTTWLLERATAEQRATWAYHHREQIDPARWADMVRRDAQLEARVKQLEAQRQPRDPAYIPEPLRNDPDLMYNDEYVAAVVNPQAAESNARAGQAGRQGFPWVAVFLGLILGVVLLGVASVVILLIFTKRGKPSPRRPVRTEMYNPLSAKCGAFISMDELDYRGKNFRVVEIQEYDHAVGGNQYQLVNYVLRAGEEVARLRVVPAAERWRAMLLTLYDELAYDEGLHNVVRDDTLKFVVDDAEAGLHEEYWRVEDVRDSYKARVTILRGEDADSPPETSRAEVEYWDYWRDTEVDGAKVTQYLYVEMNTDTGWFQIWRGMETEPERILVT